MKNEESKGQEKWDAFTYIQETLYCNGKGERDAHKQLARIDG